MGQNQRDLREIKLQVVGRSGPNYDNLNVYIPSHFHKAATLGINDPTVEASRRRLADNMAGQGMEWPQIKEKIQEIFACGKLTKWCATPEGAQAEIDKCWKYFNSANLG